MTITENALHSPGTRVRIRRGRFPLDPSVVGRTGTVVDASSYRPESYGVVLDGERRMRMFAPGELEVTEAPPLVPPDRRSAKERPALP